jgi:tRNA threonylcarbamoyladenosine biosynthesis protein TsaB
LGIDTSTSSGSVALVDSGKTLAEWSLNVSGTHAARLLPGIRRLLEEVGIPIGQIDGFAVTTGPGSFTGLRIALTTAKTLSLVTGKPLAGIPTLDVLVENIPFARGLVCPVLDARRGEVFAAVYQKNPQGGTDRLTDYLSVPPEALSRLLQGPALLLGTAVPVYGDRFLRECAQPLTFAPPECHFPRASILCRLAFKKLSQGDYRHPRELQALYARAPDAERKRSGQTERTRGNRKGKKERKSLPGRETSSGELQK